MINMSDSALAEASIGGLFSESSRHKAIRGSRMVWVFMGLLVLLAIIGFYFFWYVMCLHRGGSASGFSCNCGDYGKYNFWKLGCDCVDGSTSKGGSCSGPPTTLPNNWQNFYVCQTFSDAECCLIKPPAAAVVGSFCGSPSPASAVVLSPAMLDASRSGIPRFSPAAQESIRDNQLNGYLS